MLVTTAYRVKLDAIRAASKKYLVAQENMTVFPNMQSFARLIDAALGLLHSIDPEEKESLGTHIVYRLLRLVLKIVGNVTMFWKKWIRG
jgi:hypothetical protein